MLFMFCLKWNDEAYNHYLCKRTTGIVRSFPNWGNMNAIATNTFTLKTFTWMCSLGKSGSVTQARENVYDMVELGGDCGPQERNPRQRLHPTSLPSHPCSCSLIYVALRSLFLPEAICFSSNLNHFFLFQLLCSRCAGWTLGSHEGSSCWTRSSFLLSR